jgi:mRNA-degrading endonuclease RelE of RelBE toxin-antitoxin system
MATRLEVPERFLKRLRPLARKYPALLIEYEKLGTRLKADERPGDKVPGVGYDVYKVRLKNPSARKGKSGGFRVLYYVQLADKVVLLTIYSKTEQTDIIPAEIRRILEEVVPLDGDDPE